MGTIDAFLEKNSGLKQEVRRRVARPAELRLPVFIESITPDDISFHFKNVDYRVAREDVTGIEEREDLGQTGTAATLILAREARLIIDQEVSASDVVAAIPFSLFRASQTSPDLGTISPKEAQWRLNTGFASAFRESDLETLEAFATGSKSFSEGSKHTDDSIVDDGV